MSRFQLHSLENEHEKGNANRQALRGDGQEYNLCTSTVRSGRGGRGKIKKTDNSKILWKTAGQISRQHEDTIILKFSKHNPKLDIVLMKHKLVRE